MAPFFTTVYSDTASPLRMAFKLSSNPPLPASLTYPTNYLLFIDTLNLPLFSTFQCLLRAWSL